VIANFGDDATGDLFHGSESARVRRFPANLRPRALRKLDLLNGAADVNDLRAPPSNHFEKLSGSLAGFWSIRVNDQWRIVFRWNDSSALDVRLTDYH
jgi:proteic killer suppression protein